MLSGRTWTRGALALLAAGVLTASLLTGCGDDKKNPTTPGTPANPVVTEAMAGVWSFTITLKDCATQTVLSQSTDSYNLCPGESILSSVPVDSTDCEITQNGDTYHVHCSTVDSSEGCTSTTTINLDLTYTNTTVHAAGEATIADNPSGCSGFPEGTACIDVAGTRIANLPQGACQ